MLLVHNQVNYYYRANGNVEQITLIRNFPQFEVLTEAEYAEYDEFVKEYTTHCDFSLNNLLIWFMGDEGIAICKLNGNLVLRITDPVFQNAPGDAWYTVIGNRKADETIDSVFRYMGIEKLIMVPDFFVEALVSPGRYKIVEDLSNCDYVFDVNSLVRAEGGRFEQYRYQVSRFLRSYGHLAEIDFLNLGHGGHATNVLEGLANWPSVLSFDANGNDPKRSDEQAIRRLIALQGSLRTKHRALGVFINGELEGFSIFHIPPGPRPIALGNHIKYNAAFDRMFDFLVFVTASVVCDEGIVLLNGEQDMGIPGIRHHKKRLNPVDFYRRYTIFAVSAEPD